MNIYEIIEILQKLHLNYKIEHFEINSKLTIASNSCQKDTYIIFQCDTGDCDEIGIEKE